MTRSLCAALALCLSMGCTQSLRPAAPGPQRALATDPVTVQAAPSDGALVVADVALPNLPARHFQLQIPACPDTDGCPFVVALLEKERVVARLALDWAKAVSTPALWPAHATWGVSDPLEQPQSSAAVTGDASGFVATLARPLALDADVAALLVDQFNSLEPTKRAHHVVLARGDRLELAFTHAEEPGPTWSSAAPLEISPGRQGVALFTGARSAGTGPGTTDVVEANLIYWSTQDRKLRVSSLDDRLRVVVVGPLKNVAAAIALRERQRACLDAFSIVAADVLPQLRLKGALLIQLGTSASGAERVLADVRGCATGTQSRIVSFE